MLAMCLPATSTATPNMWRGV